MGRQDQVAVGISKCDFAYGFMRGFVATRPSLGG